MSNTFTLDAIVAETVRRYAPVEVDLGDGDVVELKSLLRLREKDRKAVMEAIDEINDLEYDDDADEDDLGAWSDAVSENCAKVFKIITGGHKKLVAKLDHDDPIIKANLHTAVLSRWVGESQLGEAVSSPTS